MLCKKGVLRNFVKFTGKHLCQSLLFNKVAGPRPATLLKKETLAQVLSYGFYEISKNTFFYRTPLVAASKFILDLHQCNNFHISDIHIAKYQILGISRLSIILSLKSLLYLVKIEKSSKDGE